MPVRQPALLSVTWNQVAAFRLARHHLLERASFTNLASVVDDMAGAQAQLHSAAQISLWARVHDLHIDQVEAALNERRLVKAACMRNTLFLVPADQLAIFVRGAISRAEKEVNWARGKGVPDRVLDAAIDSTLNALSEPLTRPEIAEHVSRALGVQQQAVHGGGWGSRRKVAAVPVGALTYPVVDLLHLDAVRGVICYGPYHDNEPTFVRADVWLPGWQAVPVEQAENRLLHKYLRTYAPATAADFAMWSGLSLTVARAIWAREAARLSPVAVEGWAATVLQADLDELAQAKFERPQVRLLPYFDSYLLGHKGRDHLVSERDKKNVFRAQGWIAPVVLVDGRVIGVWGYHRPGNCLQFEVTKFESVSTRVNAAIKQAARDLAHFLEVTDLEIQLN